MTPSNFVDFETTGYWRCTCCAPMTGMHCEECGKKLDNSEFMDSPLGRSLCKGHRSVVEGNVHVGNKTPFTQEELCEIVKCLRFYRDEVTHPENDLCGLNTESQEYLLISKIIGKAETHKAECECGHKKHTYHGCHDQKCHCARTPQPVKEEFGR